MGGGEVEKERRQKMRKREVRRERSDHNCAGKLWKSTNVEDQVTQKGRLWPDPVERLASMSQAGTSWKGEIEILLQICCSRFITL